MPVRRIGGRDIHYREAGEGPLVIALHCSSSHSGQWKPFMEAVGGGFRVIAPDLHGYGRSDPLPEDGRPFFFHDAESIAAFLDDEGPGHLVGHSLGGAVGLAVARQRPDLVSLTMIEPVLFGLLTEAGLAEACDPEPVAAAIAAALDRGEPDAAARAFVSFWSGAGAFDAMAPHVQAYVIATIRRVRADFDGLLATDPRSLKLDDARALRLPVHVICGTGTRASAKAIVDLLARTVPGAVRTDVPGAAHMAAATDPGLINPHIAAFLDANTG